MTTRRIITTCSLLLLGLSGPLACSDDSTGGSSSDTDTETGTAGDGDGDMSGSESESDSAGDGDGDDPATMTDTDSGDGDGDPTDSGDGDGDPTDSGDGDGDPTDSGDGDGDPTDSGDGDGDTGDGDGDPTDTGDGDGDTGDGDGDTGDGDGDMMPMPDGSSPENAGISCKQINDDGLADGDGLYWVDPDGPMMGEEPFEVDCDMSTDGGGWTRLRLEIQDNLVVAEFDVSNAWDKCDDDSAQFFDWISEDMVTPELSPNAVNDTVFDLEYANPGNDTLHTPAQLDLLRNSIAELNASTRMVALTSDDDSLDWQNDMSGGHEVIIIDINAAEYLLTPGEDGQCGGANDWPLLDSQSGYYLYNHDDADTIVAGETTGVDSDALLGLPPEALIPVQVRMVIDTGGGAAFGYERQVFLVR